MQTPGCIGRPATAPAPTITSRLALALVVVACSPAPETTTPTTRAQPSISSTVPTSIPPTTTFAVGELASWERIEVLVGETALTVALADEESERQVGLTGVSDLGDFEGMLFAWDEEVTTGFWMKDTPIALDLFFFDAEGGLVDQTSLEPCPAEPCPVFVAERLFRWVLEAPAGSLEATGKLSFPGAD